MMSIGLKQEEKAIFTIATAILSWLSLPDNQREQSRGSFIESTKRI
jgi:hypothetical protein